MRSKLAPVLALCALVTSTSVSRAQNGPDADPDAAPGYTQSVFHHASVDSVNLYNGQLTIPIALGPAYPVGPKLTFQAMLAYTSTVWEFGNPGPDNQSDVGLYQPIKADPSLAVGFSLTAGAIKPCGILQASQCYLGADGSEHQFTSSPAAHYFKTGDTSQLLLHDLGATLGYEMWDGDGTHYTFGWHVTGYDDAPQNYIFDLGRGRNGWYLTALADPYGNALAFTYFSGLGASSPCWTPGHCPTATNSWILRTVKRGATTLVTVNLGSDAGAPGITNLVTSLEFAVAGGATATWTLSRGTVVVTRGEPNVPALTLPTLNALKLPTSPTPQYAFTWNAGGADSSVGGLLKTLTVPTGGVVSYFWGGYGFYHGRTASLSINCAPLGPPNNADVKQSGRPAPGVKTNGPEPLEPDAPSIAGTDCTLQNPDRWLDHAKGVVRRTETFARADGAVVDAVTDYAQWAFPFGEQGSLSNNLGPQSLTLVTQPADQNGHRVASATLFLGPRAGTLGGAEPGGRIGADVCVATFDHDPYPGFLLPFPQPLCGSAADALCVTHAVRVAQRSYEYDLPDIESGNRRLRAETTYYGPTAADGSCSGCATHAVAFTNFGSDTWEGNGRHFGIETHSGNLGADARTITTDWAPANWTSMPAAGQTALPNLTNRRTEMQGASVADRYYEFDATTGFLDGTFVYDPARDVALVNCRWPDGRGAVDRELTKTVAASSPPPRTYCSNTYPSFPAVGTDGDMFGKAYTSRYGQVLTAAWINGAASGFSVRDLTRDDATGWITASRDSAGLATSYAYDPLGRVTQISPPAAAELKTRVCYDSPSTTTAYRASSAQACPVASSNGAVATWEHYDYDGLGRAIREQRLQPAAAVTKRFTLFDGAGHGYFQSEWVSNGTSEAVTADLSTTCVFAGGNIATGRPSGAPGSYQLCWDPFGRAQQAVGAKHSSLAVVARSDAGVPYSDTLEQATVYCVKGTFTAPAAPTCSSGAINAATTARRDAFGRLTSLTEPSGEATTYAYDVKGKLLSVTQGAQFRSFDYDTTGLLRSEATPEGGSVTYASVGSLGNVRQETRPGGVIVTRAFDYAGRVTEEDAAGNRHLVNCYDGAPACVDGSAGGGGGAYRAGKLTRRYGYNRVPTIGPIVDEQFEYADGGGRLSKLVTSVGNGGLAASAAQTWTYGSLGLVATHGHPRTSGDFTVTPSYANGLPTAIAAASANVVTAATYGPGAVLASWTSGASLLTTIAPDLSGLPRPGSISNSFWSTGAYTYDGAGNILKMGTDAFTYDSRSRLLSAKYGSTTRTFAYDRYGNLTSNGSPITVDTHSNHVTSGGAVYDASGDLTAYAGGTMAYDALDRQYRNSNGSGDWVFLFNGAGERVAKFPAKSPVLRREMARYVAEANILAKGWTLPACSGAFSDVSCTDPDSRHIQLVYDKAITGGCATNPLQYCPNDTLTRAQMAVFLVKGYKPAGFAPPACVGTFTDVACAGPYAAFAPWIEQLYRDGVTGGCSASPLQFCPGNAVGEWEMLVWLAKAPGSAPGTTIWNAYHPAPRATIYTFRDEHNRVVTEMTGGSSGLATATLSVTRDNVFLGNLLVASYVASPAGWQYTVSDHLGSPRAVFNQSGQLVESHKHWPYGEDTNAVPSTQRLGYCLMEKEDGASRSYDHVRTHDIGLGRFLSPDLVGGDPRNPQSWNRYAYTLGNPMKHIDPDGLLTIVVHGTWANGNATFQPGGQFAQTVARTFGDRTVSFQWSGTNTTGARAAAARDLANLVRQYKFAPGEKLNIVAHSHGGNVAITAINQILGHRVDNLITLGTPSLPGYRLLDGASVKTFIAASSSHDPVQVLGGRNLLFPLLGETGVAGREEPGAINMTYDRPDSLLSAHGNLHESGFVWNSISDFLMLSPGEQRDQLNQQSVQP
jgi:RHS repeat-associated protein